MDTSELRVELHRVIDHVKDNKVLAAVYTLLTSSTPLPRPLSDDQIEDMLEASELAISEGRSIDHQDLKEQIKSWRKK